MESMETNALSITFQTHIRGLAGSKKKKLRPHGDVATPPMDAKGWHPTVEQCTTVIYELKHNTAPDAGGWITESAKAVFLLPHLPQLRELRGGRGSPNWRNHIQERTRQGPGMPTN